MPTLNFTGKDQPPPQPASLQREALTFPPGCPPEAAIGNRLILGDNLSIMAALLPEYEGRIDLIYADPPFFTNRQFAARIGRGEDSRKPRGWALAEGYPDQWQDLDAYLAFLHPRLQLMHRLLAPTGTLYLHLDWHANAYARLLLDEIFGPERLLNEIIWAYHGPSPIRSAFNRKHDTILAYTKSRDYTFNADAVRVPYNDSTVKTFAASPKAGFGKVPDLQRGKVPEDWWYFPVVARLHTERSGYPTQKPAALLERIILASSNPGNLVADFFCGSGTTPLVAARHGRKIIASDISWRAIHTARARLLAQPNPFSLERAEPSNWRIAQRPAPVTFTRQAGQAGIASGDASLLDYWEVDPDWDETLFHSRAQAVRPVRLASIAASLPICETKPGRRVCVRAVSIHGEQFQITL